MGIEFGPDGNLYVIDRQIAYDKNYKTRIVRIIVEQGVARRMEVVAVGSIGANDLRWHNDVLYVTESVAANPAKKGAPTVSGIYALPLAEMDSGPIYLRPYRGDDDHDVHQILTFHSNGTMGSGADGIAFDDHDNLYVSIIEEAAIYRVAITAGRKAGAPVLLVKGSGMQSADGLTYDSQRRILYVADFLGNAVHAVGLDGSVQTLQKNGNSSAERGQLDQPCATQIWNGKLIVSNMDYAGANPGLSVNTHVDDVHALSQLDLTPGNSAE